MRAHEATCPVCLSICLKAHTAYRGPGGGGGSSGPQATVDPTSWRSPCWPAGGPLPTRLCPQQPRWPPSRRLRVPTWDDNMWKTLHILQDVRVLSGRLGLGTQGDWPSGPCPGSAFLSDDSPAPGRSLGLGEGRGGGGSAPPPLAASPHGRSAGGSLVPDYCGGPRTRPPSPPRAHLPPALLRPELGTLLHHDGPGLQLRDWDTGCRPVSLRDVVSLAWDWTSSPALYHPKGQLPPSSGSVGTSGPDHRAMASRAPEDSLESSPGEPLSLQHLGASVHGRQGGSILDSWRF